MAKHNRPGMASRVNTIPVGNTARTLERDLRVAQYSPSLFMICLLRPKQSCRQALGRTSTSRPSSGSSGLLAFRHGHGQQKGRTYVCMYVHTLVRQDIIRGRHIGGRTTAGVCYILRVTSYAMRRRHTYSTYMCVLCRLFFLYILYVTAC